MPIYSQTKSDTLKAAVPATEEGDLKSKVIYNAKDSMRFDISKQKVFLFGEASVSYEEINLIADYIEIDFANNLVTAEAKRDSTGKIISYPEFSEADKKFKAESMKYNYETKKGKIIEVVTNEGDGFIHGETVKKDTGNVYFIKHGKYTTCDLSHPHFYIGANKLKVIPDDKIVTGPAYLVISDVPTPLAVPFGFFPNRKGRSSGIIIPTYGESPGLGFFLRDGGYYFGINDYVDAAIKGDIFSRGSWAMRGVSNYKKRYKYNGNFNFNYAIIKQGIAETPEFTKSTDFFVRWSHAQDAKANPSSRFSANVNAGSSDYNRFLSNGANYLTNTFQSNIQYTKVFLGTPLILNASANHSQNTLNKTVDVTLPQLSLVMNRVFPFKRKVLVGETRWYEKIGLNAASDFSNRISTKDSLFFKPETLNQMKNGINNTAQLSSSFNFLKYFTITPAVNMSSKMYFNSIQKRYEADSQRVVVDTLNAFKMSGEYSLSANLNTKLYGMLQFRKGPVKAIRHVAIPNIGFVYKPDFSEEKYGYYKTVQTNSLGRTETYSVFSNGLYGGPSAGKSQSMSFALNNNVEMKVKNKSDTAITDRKITLIEALNISSGYNWAAKNFKWSAININGRTTLFKSLMVLGNMTLDPYRMDSLGKRIERLTWNQNKTIGRITNASLALSKTFRFEGDKDKKPKKSDKATPEELEYINAHPEQFIDLTIPFSLNVSYNLSYSKPGIDEQISQALAFNGDINVTSNWRVGFNSGYDFETKKLSYTSLNIYRDLHCWEMIFNWIPFGPNQQYSIDIKVKSSVLQDLKLSRRRSWYDFN